MTGNPDLPRDPGYAEPGGRAPAPSPLRLVQVFVNTADLEAGTDALDSPEHLADWLAHHELLPAPAGVTGNDLALALDLREGMRALFLSHHDRGGDQDLAGLEHLDLALARLPLRLRTAGGVIDVAPLHDSSTVRGALARIAAVLIRADPAELTRLKACRREVCRWVFYDSSRNRGSTWCAMDICGVRTKMRTYRDRQRTR